VETGSGVVLNTSIGLTFFLLEKAGWLIYVSQTTGQVKNITIASNQSQTVSYQYSSYFDNPPLMPNNKSSGGVLEQSFSFSTIETTATFGSPFVIPPSSLKWTINISSSFPFPDGLSITYLLRDLSSSLGDGYTVDKTSHMITSENTTTYLLPLLSSKSSALRTLIQVEVFDFVLVDDAYILINHSVALGGPEDSQWVLHLQFPAFKRSLYYDPVVGLGMLVGGSSMSSGGQASLGIIIGAAVGGSVAALIILGVAVGLLVIWKFKRQRRSPKRNLVNFDGLDN